MKNPVKVIMIGINGYGHYYLKTFLEETDCDEAVLVGVVDPEAERSIYYNAFKEYGIPVFNRMNDFYLGGGKADLAVISSPPHFHVPQSILALHNHTNVLCEKPLSSLVSEAEKLIKKKNKSGKFVMVGYQWSFSEGIQDLKRDILERRFGNPLRIKALCLWPRDYAYFTRNKWAYRNIDEEGNAVRDNLFSNAMAHFIHNMLFLLGDTMETASEAVDIKSQLCRANQIETYDTGLFCARTPSGVDLLFMGTHAGAKTTDPCFRIEFESGFAELKPGAKIISAKTLDKKEIAYPSPDSDHQFKKLFAALKNLQQPGNLVCTPETALPHAKLVEQIHNGSGTVGTFSGDKVIRENNRLYVQGLDELLLSAYRNFRIPSDLLNLQTWD